MACWRSNTRALKGLVVMVASLGFACGGDSGSPTAPTTSPTPTPTTKSFQGVLAGVGEIGTLELTVQAAVSSLDTARVPQVASASSGSVRLAGSGGGLAMSISAGGIVSGGWINTANGASGNIRGRRSGSSLTLTSDPDIHIEGTQSGNALSGTWSDADEGGTWQVSVAGYQQETAAPAP